MEDWTEFARRGNTFTNAGVAGHAWIHDSGPPVTTSDLWDSHRSDEKVLSWINAPMGVISWLSHSDKNVIFWTKIPGYALFTSHHLTSPRTSDHNNRLGLWVYTTIAIYYYHSAWKLTQFSAPRRMEGRVDINKALRVCAVTIVRGWLIETSNQVKFIEFGGLLQILKFWGIIYMNYHIWSLHSQVYGGLMLCIMLLTSFDQNPRYGEQ